MTAHRTHNHKMPHIPFVQGNIYTLRSMPTHSSPIQQNQNILSRSPSDHNGTHTIFLPRGQTSQSTIPHHINNKEIRPYCFLQSRHRTRTLQTKQHLVKYNSKVHRTCSGQKCAPSHRPARYEARATPLPDDILEKYNN
jgi:hypothetical protein